LILLDERFEILGLTSSIAIYSVEAVAVIFLLFQISLRNLIVNFVPCFVLVILILHSIFLASVPREQLKSEYSTVVLCVSTDRLERSPFVKDSSLSKVIVVSVIAEPLSVVGAEILSLG
jgi:hypothetical protein